MADAATLQLGAGQECETRVYEEVGTVNAIQRRAAPAVEGDERRELGEAFCAFCGDAQANGVEHLPDCLHLRARALGGDE